MLKKRYVSLAMAASLLGGVVVASVASKTAPKASINPYAVTKPVAYKAKTAITSTVAAARYISVVAPVAKPTVAVATPVTVTPISVTPVAVTPVSIVPIVPVVIVPVPVQTITITTNITKRT